MYSEIWFPDLDSEKWLNSLFRSLLNWNTEHFTHFKDFDQPNIEQSNTKPIPMSNIYNIYQWELSEHHDPAS